ncbi:MAG: hypothetical protein LBP75_05680 [Planctomycetota bacterium]|nr:hypothetical protein [Planctomycetota bacterium]
MLAIIASVVIFGLLLTGTGALFARAFGAATPHHTTPHHTTPHHTTPHHTTPHHTTPHHTTPHT